MSVTITAEVMDQAGAPQVGVTVAGLDDSETSTVVVETSWDAAATWVPVQGAGGLHGLGGVFVRDHAPALGRPVVWRARVTSGPDAPLTVVSGPPLVLPADVVWVQDPLDPRSAVPCRMHWDGSSVLLAQGSLGEIEFGQVADVATPEGATLPVASIGRRVAAAQVPITMTYDVAAEGGALRRLLMSAGPVVVRGLPAEAVLDPVATVAVGAVHETRTGTGGLAVVRLVVRQVAPVAVTVVVPWWTYASVGVLWGGATYEDVAADRPGETYLDFQAYPGPSS